MMQTKQNLNNKFWLDSLSAFKEYCRYKPDSIVSVVAGPKLESKLRSILSDFDLKIDLIIEEKESFKAKIKFDYLLEYEGLEKISVENPKMVLVLDHITDTRNFGAIARTAAFLGVRTIVVPDKRQAPVNETVFSTAQGAFAIVDVVKVVNLTRTLKSLKKLDYWVLGADMSGEPSVRVRGIYEKSVLVMGSEEKGISLQVHKNCDRIVRIEGADTSIDSLNVSVAAGILMHEIVMSK